MDRSKCSIGFFDSGVGGISVLREAVKMMPNENLIFYGDSHNAPYGTRTPEEVRELSFNVADKLIEKNVKAIVVACNTATSAAINELREKYSDIPVIGIEPALKPAVEKYGDGIVVIMATPMTLKENKFAKLREKYSEVAEMVSMPCPGLVELIESGKTDGEEVEAYLKEKFKDLPKDKISSVVLGCTHYPFVKKALSNVLGSHVELIDGSEGTIRQLKRLLEKENLLNTTNEKGSVVIYNSSDDERMVRLSYELLQQ